MYPNGHDSERYDNAEDVLWLPMTTEDFTGPCIVSGDGARVIDAEGQDYLAATSGLWNLHLGYGDHRVTAAIVEQAQRLPYATLFRYRHDQAIKLAAALVELAPPRIATCFFTCSGGTAVDTALKAVRKYWDLEGQPRRKTVFALDGSYHGATIGSMSVSEAAGSVEAYGIDRRNVQFLRWDVDADEPDVTALRARLEASAIECAAVIVEPVQGSYIRALSRAFVGELRALRDELGFLLIVDEVTTGFGRTGDLFASNWLQLDPDVMLLGKGLNAGYLPLGAALFSRRICEAFRGRDVMFQNGETQGGNPIACAAALATLGRLDSEDLLRSVEAKGRALLKGLETLQGNGVVRRIRGFGLMIAVLLEQGSGAEAPWQVVTRLQSAGVIVHAMPGGIALLPPLTLTDEDIQELLRRCGTVLSPRV